MLCCSRLHTHPLLWTGFKIWGRKARCEGHLLLACLIPGHWWCSWPSWWDAVPAASGSVCVLSQSCKLTERTVVKEWNVLGYLLSLLRGGLYFAFPLASELAMWLILAHEKQALFLRGSCKKHCVCGLNLSSVQDGQCPRWSVGHHLGSQSEVDGEQTLPQTMMDMWHEHGINLSCYKPLKFRSCLLLNITSYPDNRERLCFT